MRPPSTLALEARRAAWDRLWTILLAEPAAESDPNSPPPSDDETVPDDDQRPEEAA